MTCCSPPLTMETELPNLLGLVGDALAICLLSKAFAAASLPFLDTRVHLALTSTWHPFSFFFFVPAVDGIKKKQVIQPFPVFFFTSLSRTQHLDFDETKNFFPPPMAVLTLCRVGNVLWKAIDATLVQPYWRHQLLLKGNIPTYCMVFWLQPGYYLPASCSQKKKFAPLLG